MTLVQHGSLGDNVQAVIAGPSVGTPARTQRLSDCSDPGGNVESAPTAVAGAAAVTLTKLQ